MPGLKERAKTLPQIIDMASFILGKRPIRPEAAGAKVLAGMPGDMLEKLTSRLQHARWEADDLERAVRDFSEAEGVGLGKIAQPLRVALSGRTVSLGVFDMMEILGRDESIARLSDCIGTVPSGT
jgi:glutamyl-tRNA synthetase